MPRVSERLCSIHLLRFAEVAEFPDEKPDVESVLQQYAKGRCQSRVVDREASCQRRLMTHQHPGGA